MSSWRAVIEDKDWWTKNSLMDSRRKAARARLEDEDSDSTWRCAIPACSTTRPSIGAHVEEYRADNASNTVLGIMFLDDTACNLLR